MTLCCVILYSLVCLKSPAAAIAIPACGVANLRVRRWAFPQAAFSSPF